MMNSSKTLENNKSQWLWIFLLALALVCGQNFQLHLHSLDHNHPNTHDSIIAPGQHSHSLDLHLALDNSHASHHVGMLAEINASQNAILEQLLPRVMPSALLGSAFVLLLAVFYPVTQATRHQLDFSLPERPHVTPPLRAPPR